MSDLTPTNKQSLEWIKSNAKKNNMKVTLQRGENFGLGCGVDVFVHPPNISENELKINREKYFKAWFMKL